MEIFDRKGLACKDKQKLKLEVCTCEKAGTCDLRAAHQRDALTKVGIPAIGVLIAALILLMCESKTFIHSFHVSSWFTVHHLLSVLHIYAHNSVFYINSVFCAVDVSSDSSAANILSMWEV